MPEEILLQAAEVAQLEAALVDAILARHPDASRLALIGIRTRGAILAERIKRRLDARVRPAVIPLGTLDITLYRDDLDRAGPRPMVGATEIPFNVVGRQVVLVDDVLYTGRTIRAALDEIIDFGRPASIQLAVLVDRGQRELPIQPDYVGRTVAVPPGSDVRVRLQEKDGQDQVVIDRR